MPIYAYKCSSCGHAQDVLQKIADAPLASCPACGSAAFAKQITAAGFQLKGSGWYATDFRNGTSKPTDKPTDKPADSTGGDTKGGGESKPADAASTPAATAACGSGGCAACT